MANAEHVDNFRKGPRNWNEWRRDNPEVVPDLREAVLRGGDFRPRDLNGVDLREANLREADFSGADLSGADFRRASLTRANLLWANLREADFSEANLSGANLSGANLVSADLRGANLSGANLSGAAFCGADLSGADLGGADLRGATLHSAKLDGAILTNAKLWEKLRAGWSIKGVICERAFWDEKAVEPTEYGPGEFERLYSDEQLVQLIYPDAMTRFELNTLPALIYHLEKVLPGAKLRLKSVEEAAGRAKVSIVVENTHEASFDEVQKVARALQAAQLELRDERRRRKRLEIEKRLLLDEVFPRVLAASAPKQMTATASGGSTIVIESPRVIAASHEAINDVDAIKAVAEAA